MVLVIGGSYQGKTKYALDTFGNVKYFNQLHLFIKKRLLSGASETDILMEINEATSQGQWVVIADEIGNGVVPISGEDRHWREVSGRILIALASQATEVHRVVAGIGQRIK